MLVQSCELHVYVPVARSVVENFSFVMMQLFDNNTPG